VIILKNDVIRLRQLMALAVVGLMSAVLRLIPNVVVTKAGAAGWLAPVAAIVPLLLLVWVMAALTKSRQEGEGMTQIFYNVLGPAGGRILAILFALWLIIYGGFTLRAGSERLLSAVYRQGNINVFMLVTLAAAAVGAWGRVSALARSAEVFSLFLIGIFLIVFGFSLPNMEGSNLLPVSYLDTGNILMGALPVVNVASPFIYYFFLAGHVKKQEKSHKVMMYGLLGALLFILLLLLTTIGTFGAALAAQLQNTFFAMVRNIKIFDIIERIESVVISVWVVTDFVYLAALMMISAEILKTVFGAEKRRSFVPPIAIAFFIVAKVIAPNAFSLTWISQQLMPGINLGIAFLVFPCLLLIGRLRKRV